MEEKPKRRWFAFSLRGLFIAVAVLSVWLAWQLSWIRERHALLPDCPKTVYFETGYEDLFNDALPDAEAPWSLRLFGERGIAEISYEELTNDEDAQWLNRARNAFPEAVFVDRLAFRKLPAILKNHPWPP